MTLGECLPAQASPGSASGKEPAYQGKGLKRHRCDPWVEGSPWKRTWQSTPIFLLGESPWTEEPGGLRSVGSQSAGPN